MNKYSIFSTEVENHASIKDDLVRIVRENVPPRPEFSSEEQEKEYDTRYSAQEKTHEELFKLDEPSIKLLNEQINSFASSIIRSQFEMETQFGLLKYCDPENKKFGEMWHCHEYPFSVVYFAQIPDDIPFPQSYFTYLAPNQQYIKPSEGLLIGMFQNLIHDGIKPWDGDYERIVIVSEFSFKIDPWHKDYLLEELNIDREDPLLDELYEHTKHKNF